MPRATTQFAIAQAARYNRQVSRLIGLRGQLLGGLSLILAVATATAGAIGYFTTRAHITELQLASGRQLGQGLATLFAPGLGRGGVDAATLQRVASAVSGGSAVRELDLVDEQLVVRASTRHRPGVRLADPELSGALRREAQVVGVRDEGSARVLAVSTPVVADGRVQGVVRTLGALGLEQQAWPLLFWALLTVDGLMLVLFVALVVTRYVLRPLGAMQQAARRVARGDLGTRLDAAGGAEEFASLAESFNAMTCSVQEQLARLAQQSAELAASREHLIRSEKLASVGRLAAGVAHEVGNPLQGIIGFTELLLGAGLSADERQDFLRRVQAESQRIHRIVRELLDYARPVEDAVEAVALAAVVEHALQLVGPQRRLRELEVLPRGLAELPAVAANAPRLVQVLVNLLLNAADALAGPGRITISGRAAEPELVELLVANSGPPIPVEHRGRIFDPFFTTKEPGEGTGLGLSVAQAIVESYGGRLTLREDEPETTFAIVLHRWRS